MCSLFLSLDSFSSLGVKKSREKSKTNLLTIMTSFPNTKIKYLPSLRKEAHNRHIYSQVSVVPIASHVTCCLSYSCCCCKGTLFSVKFPAIFLPLYHTLLLLYIEDPIIYVLFLICTSEVYLSLLQYFNKNLFTAAGIV